MSGNHDQAQQGQVVFHLGIDDRVAGNGSDGSGSHRPSVAASPEASELSMLHPSTTQTTRTLPSSSVNSDNVARTQAEQDTIDDEAVLEKMGYKQELFRGFDAFMNFSFCMTSVAVISSIVLGFNNSLVTGGPSVIAWAWLVASIFTILIGANMAEICSTYPSAGSVYHWAGMLASERTAPLLSYICGWFNFIGNAAGDAAYAWGFASVVSAANDLSDYHNYEHSYNSWYATTFSAQNIAANAQLTNCSNPNTMATLTAGPPINYNPNHISIGAQVGLAIGAAATWAVKNTFRVDHQGWLNNFSSLWQMGTVGIIIIVLLAVATTRNSASWIFGRFNDGLGFDGSVGAIHSPAGFTPAAGTPPSSFNDIAYICFIGLANALFSQSGYEAGGHMAEETKGATRSAPNGILYTTIATTITGFVFIMAILATVPNGLAGIGNLNPIDPVCSVPSPGVYTNSVFATFYSVCGYNGAMVLAFMIILDMFFAGFSSLTVTTRIGFAMARDNAFPGSSVLKYIDPRSQTPVAVITLVFLLDSFFVLFVLITMNDPLATSPLAFSAVTSITVIGYQISYAIPIIQRAFMGDRFVKSAFNLGSFGAPLGALTGFWLVATSIIMLFPTTYYPSDASGSIIRYNMNYTPVVVAATFVVACTFWIFDARFHFKGPSRGTNDAVTA